MPPAFNLSQDQTLEFNLAASSLLKVRLAPRGARLASNAGESPHSSAISIVQEPLPSTRREGRRIGDETHILHASNSASSPREKKSEDFSEGPFFSSEAPAVRPRPRQAESDVFYTAENKKQAPRQKKFAMLAQRAFLPVEPRCGKTCDASRICAKRQVSGGIPILASSSKPLKPHRAQKAQTTSKRHAAVESAPNGTIDARAEANGAHRLGLLPASRRLILDSRDSLN